MKINRISAEGFLVQLNALVERPTDVVASIGTASGADYLYVLHMKREDKTEYEIRVYPDTEQKIC